ncbi:glycoside hydrolase family protein [Clostridium hydrogenum]|uniref:glycoside hydrolase family protein n=1 Tax=Clostridium hydrogenum TaxID=2855764 RepID=UPI001F22110F|nr:glycoside hydrolase family protein [Clostridium hydrogenum]
MESLIDPTANASITYNAHVQNIGWQNTVSNGATAGTTGQGLAMQAIQINYPNQVGLKLQYQAHVQNIGWQDPVSDGQTAGTTGQNLQMEAIKIAIVDSSGNLSTNYSVYYRTHIANLAWTTWTKDGQQSGTTGQGLAIQAIQICVAKVGTDFYRQMESLVDPAANTSITYDAHVANVGWQNAVSNGATAGTTDQNLDMQAIQINYPNQAGLKVQYQAHVQNIGWQDPVSDGQTAGTTGQGLRMEAIKISLLDSSNNLSTNYSVYYRTYVANLGWTVWIKDGQQSGTTGQGLAIQGIQIYVAKVGTDFYRQMETKLTEPAEGTGTQAGSRASANLIYFIKGCEGFGQYLYHDEVGVLTEGYGMTGSELNGLPSTINEATATTLLANNVNNLYYSQVLSLLRARGVKNPSQREVDALTSFAYNLGINSLRSSTLLKLYVSGSRGEDIHNEFMKWVYAGGTVLPGLVTRRTYEWDIFSNSSAKVPGYNCAPSISYIGKDGRPTGKVVTENNGYGAGPY